MIKVDVAPVIMRRTEEGKRLRKAYEHGLIHHGFNEHRVMDVHWGGVQHDFYGIKRFSDMRGISIRST